MSQLRWQRGELAIECEAIWHSYSTGARYVKLAAGQRLDVDVPVVSWRDEISRTISDFGADIDDRTLELVLQVRPGGPAAAAGLQTGDVLAKVDGASVAQLTEQGAWILIANRPPGTTVKITVTRAGKSLPADLVLRPGHE